jgi:small subunit ribosomal protein S3
MSVVKRIVRDGKERMNVDELLGKEFEQAGYGGITLTKTPLGAQINLYTMRPGRVIGKRGRAIKEASERLEKELGLANPQITVVEVEIPELNPQIMASRVANALERGVHFRRSMFWSLRRIMDSGALGCEITLKGPIRSARARFERVSEGYIPKAGYPSQKYLRHATIHVKMKRGILGVTVNIVPPDAKFPDKISLEGLPEIQYPEETYVPEGVEAEAEATEQPTTPEAPTEGGEVGAQIAESVPEAAQKEPTAPEEAVEAVKPEAAETEPELKETEKFEGTDEEASAKESVEEAKKPEEPEEDEGEEVD